MYAAPWFLAARDLNVRIMQEPNPPRTPEAFAAQYPALSAICWLTRVDLFTVVSGGWDSMDMIIEITHQYRRHIGISISITLVCLILLLHRSYTKRWGRAIAYTTQALLGIFLILLLTQTAGSFIQHKRVVPVWDRTRDSNILNNHYRFEDMNHDVHVPENYHGVILVKSAAEDIHIAMDRRGWLSINNVMLTKSNLVEIIASRSTQTPPPRFLLWMDRRSNAEDRDELINLATNMSPDNTYFVVREGNDLDIHLQFTGLHHNKGIDPYAPNR